MKATNQGAEAGAKAGTNDDTSAKNRCAATDSESTSPAALKARRNGKGQLLPGATTAELARKAGRASAEANPLGPNQRAFLEALARQPGELSVQAARRLADVPTRGLYALVERLKDQRLVTSERRRLSTGLKQFVAITDEGRRLLDLGNQ